MFALIALIIAAIAWAMQTVGDGLDNPWAWLFAVLVFISAQLLYPLALPVDRWRRG